MRRALVLLLSAASMTVSADASHVREVGRTDVVFETSVPCAFTCPYWTDAYVDNGGPCRPEPSTLPDSWDDIRVTVPDLVDGGVPEQMRVFIVPEIDYDLFVCGVVDPGAPNERWEEMTLCWDLCGDGICAPRLVVLLQCSEGGRIRVHPGEVFVLRAYNWLDGPTCAGFYSWMVAT